ncbi:DUF448 domain-containing protein [Sandarakinorhabdus rubra]|uniref:DUF448 domain-containing protein n=1 Tax=Sandarakinorhabdus rubra TaxID=2672568 RepID=UPI0013DB53A3|nr:DUF448 domain-containing protein [Sandarakinorhabdus rubra]
MEHNDRLKPAAPDNRKESPKASAGESQRRCLLTGEAMPRTGLIRLALAPDGGIVPDLAGKLPGRGGWISADRALFETVAARKRLQGALARALKSNAIRLADDLADRIEAALTQRLLGRLGLENRAGNLIFGADRVREQLSRGKVRMLLHAGDARPDGADRMDGMARAVGESLDAAIAHQRLPFGRDALSAALGRDNVVHIGVTDAGAATRIAADLARLAGFAQAGLALAETNLTGPGAATVVAPAASERH